MRTDELTVEPNGPSQGHGSNAYSSGSAAGGGQPGNGGTPGAERFWGGFSRTRAGRSNPGQSGNGSGADRPEGSTECLDWCPICRSAELVRGTAPPDLKSQLEAIQGEAFNVIRAFMAAYAEQAPPQGGRGTGNGGRADDDRVDIPVD
ncbi:MAG: hypothetical protein ACO3CR_04715 [Solirubrobacterales bacterium]